MFIQLFDISTNRQFHSIDPINEIKDNSENTKRITSLFNSTQTSFNIPITSFRADVKKNNEVLSQ